ncbi:ABC transporter permease [Cohnella silvisoli]|uniref:ABC transporter permease n=1 Tax=Cohnella silvisoli TaxID=2873699 RepID=A0ABV1KRI4_9BACL|nr:ABC transporter permease [Cohnella silvisoli]MCD9022414.1 ABC transporter permease [Cohnella silvisoli]
MNILNIAIKEIKAALREKGTFVFMLAFPVILMLILGTALTNVFSSNTPVGNIELLYKNEAASPQLTQYWQGFAKAIEQEGVKITPLAAGTDGKLEISEDRYSAYAELSNEGITYYGSSKQTIESNILQGMLTTFADRYNMAAAALKSDPSKAEAIIRNASAPGEYIRETALNPDKQPGSIDYYAMAMTTMIALYSALSGTFLFRGERIRNTALRLMAAPVSKGEIFAGKVIGCTLINLLCVLAVVLISKFAFQADWGNHFGMVFLILVTEVILAVSLGLGLSYILKGDTSRSVVMIFLQIASFVGGAYFPIMGTDSFLGFVTNLSPLRWANKALAQIIYNDNVAGALPAIGLNVGIAAAFLLIAIISMRRQEAL